MIRHIWTATKAMLGIVVLTGWALYASQRLDREHMAGLARQATHTPDPVTTGSIRPREHKAWR